VPDGIDGAEAGQDCLDGDENWASERVSKVTLGASLARASFPEVVSIPDLSFDDSGGTNSAIIKTNADKMQRVVAAWRWPVLSLFSITRCS
jgi:hypothetical protein